MGTVLSSKDTNRVVPRQERVQNAFKKPTRKALLIGLNYAGTDMEMPKCMDDIKRAKQYLMGCRHYREEDIVVLCDDASVPPEALATHDNILKEVQKIAAEKPDEVWFHFAGHSCGQDRRDPSREYRTNGSGILPLDHAAKGAIPNNVLAHKIINELSLVSSLIAITDSHNSGMDLGVPFKFRAGCKECESTLAINQWQGARNFVKLNRDCTILCCARDPKLADDLEVCRTWRTALSNNLYDLLIEHHSPVSNRCAISWKRLCEKLSKKMDDANQSGSLVELRFYKKSRLNQPI